MQRFYLSSNWKKYYQVVIFKLLIKIMEHLSQFTLQNSMNLKSSFANSIGMRDNKTNSFSGMHCIAKYLLNVLI